MKIKDADSNQKAGKISDLIPLHSVLTNFLYNFNARQLDYKFSLLTVTEKQKIIKKLLGNDIYSQIQSVCIKNLTQFNKKDGRQVVNPDKWFALRILGSCLYCIEATDIIKNCFFHEDYHMQFEVAKALLYLNELKDYRLLFFLIDAEGFVDLKNDSSGQISKIAGIVHALNYSGNSTLVFIHYKKLLDLGDKATLLELLRSTQHLAHYEKNFEQITSNKDFNFESEDYSFFKEYLNMLKNNSVIFKDNQVIINFLKSKLAQRGDQLYFATIKRPCIDTLCTLIGRENTREFIVKTQLKKALTFFDERYN